MYAAIFSKLAMLPCSVEWYYRSWSAAKIICRAVGMCRLYVWHAGRKPTCSKSGLVMEISLMSDASKFLTVLLSVCLYYQVTCSLVIQFIKELRHNSSICRLSSTQSQSWLQIHVLPWSLKVWLDNLYRADISADKKHFHVTYAPS